MLIQTGILVGMYILTNKVSVQANRAIEQSQNLFGPMHKVIDSLRAASDKLAGASEAAQGRTRRFQTEMANAHVSWRDKLDRWSKIGT